MFLSFFLCGFGLVLAVCPFRGVVVVVVVAACLVELLVVSDLSGGKAAS